MTCAKQNIHFVFISFNTVIYHYKWQNLKALGNPEMLLPFIANFFEVRFIQDQAPVVQRILSLNSKLFAKILRAIPCKHQNIYIVVRHA